MKTATKLFVKKSINIAVNIVIYPIWLAFKAMTTLGHTDKVFWSYSQMLSLVPGTTGCYIRKSFYRRAMTYCDEDCAILFGTLFSQADTEIGKGVYIGPQCNIGKSRIEDDCTLGSGVHILSGKHQHHFDDLETPIREQGGVFEKVTIGEDSWIGNGALIMANIGKKCIIGAGSVVTRDVEDYTIVAGNPARIIRKRRQPDPNKIKENRLR